jgi:hypothetical protein
MRRERALKVVLVVVGLIFCGLAYPLVLFVKQAPALAMQFSVYVTLGIFLLFASRSPSANRSLIAFTAWSSFVHAILMAGQAFAGLIARGELIGSAVLGLFLVEGSLHPCGASHSVLLSEGFDGRHHARSSPIRTGRSGDGNTGEDSDRRRNHANCRVEERVWDFPLRLF